MKCTVLIDNRTNDPVLETEHGLSILLETECHRILLDTGASDMFIRNAERLGRDLSEVDYVFISHGHSDHAGGLKHFMAVNDKAKIIVSPDAINGKFFSKRIRQHSITTAWPNIPEERLLMISKTCEIADEFHIIAHIPQVHPIPKGNQNLFVETGDGRLVPDDFRHEMAFYVDGLLFTGCAHSGLVNILEACPWPVHTVVGGFHLLDGYETMEEINALTHSLKVNYPYTRFYTSHCTGDQVFENMKDVMGEQLQSFRCGTIIAFPITSPFLRIDR
jgi:7,8-dihydropterin-6-yl-methyl-4-(beta-D-ribofuranosyl)aminobenzene 5'-phosphate synthase